jgi:hypothetical protein
MTFVFSLINKTILYMTKSILIAFVSFVLSSSLLAQTQNNDPLLTRKERKAERLANEQVFKTKSVGLSIQNAQNTVVTPVVYSGSGISISSEKQKFFQQKMKATTAAVRYHALKAANSEHTHHSATFQFGAEQMKQFFLENLYIGGMLQMNGNIRLAPALGNNALQYEVFPTIGISSRYKRNVRLFNRPMQVEAVAKLPLAGFLVATPKYTFSFDEVKIGATSLHNMFNPQTQFWLNLPASKRLPNRQYRLGYEWNLNRFARGNGHHVTMGTHTLHLIATLHKWK